MIDPELIQLCADPRLEVEIVQQFVPEMNASDHLTIFVAQGNRTILVPKPETVEQAIETTREWVGQANVRVGLTQYPAGLGITDPSELGYELFDNCENLRMGTELFGKVLRVVTQWYGGPAEPAFGDAIYAYRTGWFEGECIFYAEDPGDVDVVTPSRSTREVEAEQFIASAMVLLGLQKLRDVESFSTMFLNYDLLARKWVPYGYIYPYAETLAGLLMLAGALMWLSVPIALLIGTIGAVSVFKAVYIDKRELKCACVGGDSNVPLGFVSLTENLMMILMAVWMLAKPFAMVGAAAH